MLDEIKHLKIYHIFGIWNPHTILVTSYLLIFSPLINALVYSVKKTRAFFWEKMSIAHNKNSKNILNFVTFHKVHFIQHKHFILEESVHLFWIMHPITWMGALSIRVTFIPNGSSPFWCIWSENHGLSTTAEGKVP